MTDAPRQLPILFNVYMVHAIRAGRKTQTRRILKPQPTGDISEWLRDHAPTRWKPGDQLWVRESFSRLDRENDCPPRKWNTETPIWYWADGWLDEGVIPKRRPGIHMPRWASRLTLSIEAVRVERLQNITSRDVAKEGIDNITHQVSGHAFDQWMVNQYALLWDSIHGLGAWDVNPWVSVTTFHVIDR
jgi:hypothetical protein